MNSNLTYVGPESQGPHYLESGKRPERNSGHICVQHDGRVVPSAYNRNSDAFAIVNHGTDEEPKSEVIFIRPVCWWHLPAAAPMTEREWFHEQFKCDEDGYFKYKGYSTKLNRDFDLRHNYTVLGRFDRLRDATGAAYDHWVAAGRP